MQQRPIIQGADIMAKVQKANILLTVPDDTVNSYLAKGYNLIDDGGAVIKSAIPTDIGVLQRAFTENQSTISNLKKEIADLKKKLAGKDTTEKQTKTKKTKS